MPAALSGPRGLRCWGKYPGAFPRFSAFSPGRRGAGSARSLVRPGRSALPETVPRGEAIHISAPLSLGSARCLFQPIFLCCSLYHAPGLFPCLFIFSLAGPARRRSPFSLPFGKKRKKHRPSMRCSLNKHRTLHLLSPCLSFLLSPCLSFLLSPCLSFLLSPCLSFLPSPCLSFLPSPCLSFLLSACFSFLLSPSPHTPPRQAKKSP